MKLHNSLKIPTDCCLALCLQPLAKTDAVLDLGHVVSEGRANTRLVVWSLTWTLSRADMF